jgi:hypothetical protein
MQTKYALAPSMLSHRRAHQHKRQFPCTSPAEHVCTNDAHYKTNTAAMTACSRAHHVQKSSLPSTSHGFSHTPIHTYMHTNVASYGILGRRSLRSNIVPAIVPARWILKRNDHCSILFLLWRRLEPETFHPSLAWLHR